jgi:hypothetical protein
VRHGGSVRNTGAPQHELSMYAHMHARMTSVTNAGQNSYIERYICKTSIFNDCHKSVFNDSHKFEKNLNTSEDMLLRWLPRNM